MNEQLIDLKVIDPNPYQKRIASNREKVVSIAMSIASDKMLQTPTGRWVGKRFQSAIGHTRTESYRLNAEIQAALANGQKYPKDVTPDHVDAVKAAIAAGRDFKTMPWVVEELSDEQMYRYATIENNQREDLSPIEKMEEMKGWVAFGYNSKQIAALYPGMSDATVRGLLSFDKLPQEAKEALHEGKISQGTARTLLSMQRIAPREKVVAAVKKIEKDGGSSLPEAIIENVIDNSKEVVDMWDEKRQDGKPRSAWSNGWLLDMKNFPNKLLPMLTPVDAVVALGIQNNEKAKKLVGDYLECLNAQYAEDPYDDEGFREEVRAGIQKGLDRLAQFNQDLADRLQHLINPPACTTCPFYTKVRGSHFCGMKTCHARKTAAWHTTMMEQASKKLGIAIYAKSDGGYRVLESYNNRSLFNSKDKGLRLILTSTVGSRSYQYFPDVESDVFVVVATGEAIGKMNGKGKSSGGGGGKMTEKEKADRRMMKVYRQRRLELMWEYTAVAQGMFESVPEPVLKKLRTWENILIDDRIPEDKKRASESKGVEYQRRALVWQLIMEMSSHYRREKLSKQLDEFQKLLGVRAPKALINQVAEWDAEIEAAGKGVSTATAKGKKA